ASEPKRRYAFRISIHLYFLLIAHLVWRPTRRGTTAPQSRGDGVPTPRTRTIPRPSVSLRRVWPRLSGSTWRGKSATASRVWNQAFVLVNSASATPIATYRSE